MTGPVTPCYQCAFQLTSFDLKSLRENIQKVQFELENKNKSSQASKHFQAPCGTTGNTLINHMGCLFMTKEMGYLGKEAHFNRELDKMIDTTFASIPGAG